MPTGEEAAAGHPPATMLLRRQPAKKSRFTAHRASFPPFIVVPFRR